jgi:hypothetical protein
MKREHLAPEARKEGLIVHELSGEVLVYDLDRHKAHCLNKTAALVWERCDGKTSVPQLVQQLETALKTPVDEEVVWLAVDQLGKSRLLQEKIAPETGRVRLSRRELIKRAGLGAALALPLVTSIIAPTAAQAGSLCQGPCTGGPGPGTCPVGCTCTAANGVCV